MKTKTKIVDVLSLSLHYITCPNCEKIVIMGEKPVIDKLKKWKRQR